MIGRHWLSFLRRYLAAPHVVGAVTPSSRFLARALAGPFAARTHAARVLEVGAGTGAVTEPILRLLGPDDHLDICEIQPEFAALLERRLLSRPDVARRQARGQVNLLCCPVQEIRATTPYDYVICGLPLTAFSPQTARDVLESIRANLAPTGVFSYFEYVGLRKLRVWFSNLRGHTDAQVVSDLLTGQIHAHEIGRRTVWFNLPPAYARYWQFNGASGGG
ncbi:MAG TPA: methyltransferase [Phycisphaerae bacterium]|jgi:phospholipid N-methyltransferase